MQQHFHLDQLAPRSDRLLDLSNCTWSADNRLIGLSPSQPRALHDALQRAPQEQSAVHVPPHVGGANLLQAALVGTLMSANACTCRLVRKDE